MEPRLTPSGGSEFPEFRCGPGRRIVLCNEAAALGTMILLGRGALEGCSDVSAADFADPLNRQTFCLLMEMFTGDGTVNCLSVFEAMVMEKVAPAPDAARLIHRWIDEAMPLVLRWHYREDA
jgi:hypothetical protein